MKKILLVVAVMLCITVAGCGNGGGELNKDADTFTITDCEGSSFAIPKNGRIVSAYGSFSECWLLSGGKLTGVTSDAIEERNLPVSEDTEIIGTVKEINVEKLVSLNPDYVIMSHEITNQLNLRENLDRMGIAYGYFKVDTFDDYDGMMKQFCAYNDRDDLYKENVTKVKKNIDAIMSSVPSQSDKTFLLMRVYSTGIKVKSDNIADGIIKEFGLTSIADKTPSLLDNLSVEHIITEDPDYIFVLSMGDEDAAREYLLNNVENNPAWNGLKAVKNGNYIILPKNLFHYKPNNRWDESYEYIAKILYPEMYR